MEKFDDILRHIYELEGLVLVAQRDGSNRDMLINMMKEKMAEINACLSTETDNVVTPEAHEELVREENTFYIRDASDDNSPTTDGSQPNAIPTETGIRADLTERADDDATSVAGIAEDEPFLPGQNTPVGIIADVSDPDEDSEPADEPTDAHNQQPTESHAPTVNGTLSDSHNELQETTDGLDKATVPGNGDSLSGNSGQQVPPPFAANNTEEPSATMTVDTLLQRNMSRDLKKAFTINDHFRFRRELFSNSDVEMNDALNLVEAMQSYDEAEEYFYDTLKWDKQSPDVIDFMAIICNHFYSK